MKKLLLITGDIAAGKSTFAGILAARYHTAVFRKDSIKEILGDSIGFHNREENLKLSHATMGVMFHVFSQLAAAGSGLILEANFRQAELQTLHSIAEAHHYQVLTLVLRGNMDILHQRYLNRMEHEHRHPVHLSTTMDVKADFIRYVEASRDAKAAGDTIEIDASDFSYQTDGLLLEQIDRFML